MIPPKMKKIYLVIFFTLLLGSIVFVFPRKFRLTINLSQNSIEIMKGKSLIAKVNKKTENLESIDLDINLDEDSFLISPFKKQQIEIIYQNGEKEIKQFNLYKKCGTTEWIKDSIKPNRFPFAAKILYKEPTCQINEKFNLSKKRPYKINFKLSNLTKITAVLNSKHGQKITFWSRPKYHHDGHIKIGKQTIPLSESLKPSSIYYLKIVLSLLLRIVFYSLLILGLISILPGNLTKTSLSLNKFNKKAIYLLLLILVTVSLSFSVYISKKVFAGIPHCQDEVAYLFQAKNFVNLQLYANSLPGSLKRFFDHEFIINDGKWFGIFPPGTSLLMTLGLLVNKPYLANPIISTISLIILFFTIKKISGNKEGLATLALLASTPFYLFNSASYLSHPASLLFTLLSVFLFFKIRQKPDNGKYWFMLGLGLGFLSLIRPANAVLLGALTSIWLIIRALKNFSAASFVIPPLVFFLFLTLIYNHQLTGNFFQFPYNYYTPYNKLGFGKRGVEWGLHFGFLDACNNFIFNLRSFLSMVSPSPFYISFIFIPFVFLKKIKKEIWFLISLFCSQIILYFFYFNDGAFYGPRFWFEVCWIPLLLNILGLRNLLEKKSLNENKKEYLILILVIILWTGGVLRTVKVIPYFKNYNWMGTIKLPESIQKPALVFVNARNGWFNYGRFFVHQGPELNEPIIFARNKAFYNLSKDKTPLDNYLLKSVFSNYHFYQLKGEKLIKL